MKDDEHNEPDTWAPLSAANKRVLNKAIGTPFSVTAVTVALSALPAKENDRRGDARRGCDKDECGDRDQREYVERRLRELAAWERKINGGRN
jgi:hypothetical protein